MSIEHVGSTDKVTVLRIGASVYRGAEGQRRFAIETVCTRVVQFIEDPYLASKLMEDNIFPKPYEPLPQERIVHSGSDGPYDEG